MQNILMIPLCLIILAEEELLDRLALTFLLKGDIMDSNNNCPIKLGFKLKEYKFYGPYTNIEFATEINFNNKIECIKWLKYMIELLESNLTLKDIDREILKNLLDYRYDKLEMKYGT